MSGDIIAGAVDRLALWDRHFVAKDGRRVFRVREVAAFQGGKGSTLAWLAGEPAPVEIATPIEVLARQLSGHFTRTHRYHLVATDRVRAVFNRYPDSGSASGREETAGGPASPPIEESEADLKADEVLRRAAIDECELEVEGSARRVPVSALYAKSVKKALGVTALHVLLPEHVDDRKLRLYGLIDFGWRELYRLDATDGAAVAAFRAAWDIRKFSRARMLTYFRQFGVNRLNKRRLMKNIVYQLWRWIRKGIEEPSDGNIRSMWYRIKGALSHHSDVLDPGDVDLYYDVLREMIEDRRLFRYKDFGFMDMSEPYRAVGAKRPEVVLAVEKLGQFHFARTLAGMAGASFICLKGEPAVISIEYFTDELRAAVGERPVTVFFMTDLDPAGASIQRSLTEGLKKQGLTVGRVVRLVEPSIFADDVAMFSKYPVVRFEVKGTQIKPLKPARMSQVTKARDWLANDVQDPRLYTEQAAEGGRKIVTIWGIESDAADRDEVRRRFLEGAARVDRRNRRA
jgi:hypothetical protein